MRFKKLFSINIRHDYFIRSVCDDLLIKPTPDCAMLLRNNRLLLKNEKNGHISVFAASNEKGQLFFEPKTGFYFDFYLVLLDADFINYSKLPSKQEDEVCFFSSQNADLKDRSLLTASVIKSPLKRVADKPLLGLIKILFTETFPASYTLHFEAAEAKWKYYLLTKNSLKNLAINGSSAGIDFNKNSTKDKNSNDDISEAINNRFPDASLVVFESKELVAYNESGKNGIQLINEDKNNVLIDHLPNPCYYENGIKIINIIN